jgi:transposase
MRKLTLNDPGTVRQLIRVATRASRDQLRLHELHCVLLVGVGHSCHDVAAWFGDSTRSIERWVGAFNRGGEGGLCACRPSGRRPRLPLDTAQRVAVEIKQPPRVCGFSEACWGGQLLMRHLRLNYGVTMSLRQCQRTLRELRADA